MTNKRTRKVIESKICDRCGKTEEFATFIDDKEVVNPSVIFSEETLLKMFTLVPGVDNLRKTHNDNYDLCNDCLNAFRKFISGEPTNGTQQN